MKKDKKGDIEYIVLKNKKTVVCRIWNCESIARERICKYTGDWSAINNLNAISDVFVGIAKCAPEDEFDIEFGKKLALTRAKEKRGKAINEVIYNYTADVRRNLDALMKYGIHEVPNPKKLYEEEV